MRIPWWQHQLSWLGDRSRFRIAIKARQIGWSTLIAYESALLAAAFGQASIVASRSQRQSNEVKRRAREWLLLMTEPHVPGLKVVKDNSDDGIILSNGGRILSVPSNPDTIAGFTGNVYLDEYSRHRDQAAIWEAMFGTISSDPSLRLSVVSTPLGCEGKYYEIVEAARSEKKDFPWSLHTCDIHQAVANGCRHDVNELRAACFDDTVYRQSYLCEFVDEAYALLPYALLAQQTDDLLPYEPDFTFLQNCGPLYAGCDVGRVRDLFVIYIGQRVGADRFVTRGIIELSNKDFDVMERAIADVMRLPQMVRMSIDKQSIGAQLAERAEKRYPGRAEGVAATERTNSENAALVKRTFSQGKITIPDRDDLTHDLHSVRTEVTAAGNIRVSAPRERGSHADRYSALALMLHAAMEPQTAITEANTQVLEGVRRPTRQPIW